MAIWQTGVELDFGEVFDGSPQGLFPSPVNCKQFRIVGGKAPVPVKFQVIIAIKNHLNRWPYCDI